MPLNVQHDCWGSSCPSTGTRIQIQERENTSRTIKIVEHADSEHFVVNMHAIHNASILHKLFPSHLYSLPPIANDRVALHHSLAAKLRNEPAPTEMDILNADAEVEAVAPGDDDNDDDDEGFAADVHRLIRLAHAMQEMTGEYTIDYRL